jgi:hypothetical protein
LCALCILPLRSSILSVSIFSKSDNNNGSDSVIIIDIRSMTQAKKAHVVHASLISGVLQHVPSVLHSQPPLYYSIKIAKVLPMSLRKTNVTKKRCCKPWDYKVR